MPPGSWQSRPRQPLPAARLRSPVDSIDSHRRRQISRRPVSACACEPLSYLPFCEQALHTAVLEYGPILTDEVWPVLAVPPEADGTFHVALHRDVDVF